MALAVRYHAESGKKTTSKEEIVSFYNSFCWLACHHFSKWSFSCYHNIEINNTDWRWKQQLQFIVEKKSNSHIMKKKINSWLVPHLILITIERWKFVREKSSTSISVKTKEMVCRPSLIKCNDFYHWLIINVFLMFSQLLCCVKFCQQD